MVAIYRRRKFDPRPFRCYVATLGKSFTNTCLCLLVTANGDNALMLGR